MVDQGAEPSFGSDVVHGRNARLASRAVAGRGEVERHLSGRGERRRPANERTSGELAGMLRQDRDAWPVAGGRKIRIEIAVAGRDGNRNDRKREKEGNEFHAAG